MSLSAPAGLSVAPTRYLMEPSGWPAPGTPGAAAPGTPGGFLAPGAAAAVPGVAAPPFEWGPKAPGYVCSNFCCVTFG